MVCMSPKMMMAGMWLAGMKSWQMMCRTAEAKRYSSCKPSVKWEKRWSYSDCDTPTETAKPSDIVQTALEAGSFNTLTQAIKASGLEDTLRNAGPFTVFAPLDEAFDAVPTETLESLLKPDQQAALQRILSYHVVPGKYTAAEVKSLQAAHTLSGKKVSISVKDGKVMVDNATVVQTDIPVANGVIHVIDTVLMPDGDQES